MPSPPSPRVSGLLRWTRALAVAAVALALGTVAHVAADGRLPGAMGLSVLLGATTGFSAAFLGRPASRGRLVGLVVTGQAFVHTGLSAMAGHRGDPAQHVVHVLPAVPASGTGPRGTLFEQYEASRPAVDAVPTVPAWVTHAIDDAVQHPWMVLAHVLAAVLVGCWLAVGERALWAVLALTLAWAVTLVRSLSGALGTPAAPPAPASRPISTARLLPTALRHPPGTSRRGPPALLAAR